MANPHHDLISRKLVLKRVKDELFLPCDQLISCKAPPYVPGSKFVYCEVFAFDPITGELSLHNQTDYSYRDSAAFATSVRMNSNTIIDAGVKSFKIYHGGTHWLETPSFERINTEELRNVNTTLPTQPLPLSINKQFAIPFTNLQFENGQIRFSVEVHPRAGKVEFVVDYPTSRKEYDAVKNYFEKAFRKKTVTCQIALETAGREITSKSARFIPDDPFNFSIIEKVNHYIVRELILNGEDPISLVEEKVKLIIILDDENRNLEGLLDAIGKVKPSKHYHHLRYLSSLHDAGIFRLRMTSKPVSFIFVIKGKRHYFLIWETYETEEATYLWELHDHNGLPMENEIKALVDKIKWLREGHKDEYLDSAPETFKRIIHDYSLPDGGISKWTSILTNYIGN